MDPPVVRYERAEDHEAVREVHRQAFGAEEQVATLVDTLRAAARSPGPLSLVATVNERVVGHVLLSACWLDALPRLLAVFSLSPLGVLPEFQRQGIGTRLVARALADADSRGIPLVFLEGSPHYYGKRGFADATKSGFRPPTLRYPPGAFQVAKLSSYQEWMTGTFVYSDTFWVLDSVGLRGERLETAARLCQAAHMATERIEVRRNIAAPPAAIFAVVSDPHGHVRIDSSGMLQAAEGQPARQVGDTFLMHMDREALGDIPLGKYDVTIKITRYEQDAHIEWTVVSPRIDPPIGHVYGYRLTPTDGGTAVTSYYDWSAVNDDWRARNVFPVISEGALRATLGILARNVER